MKRHFGKTTESRSMKLPKGVSQEFIDSIQSLSTDELKARVVTLQIQNDENEVFKTGDEYVKAQEEFSVAKERFNLVAGPVRDVTVSIKNKTRLIIERLKEKGAI